MPRPPASPPPPPPPPASFPFTAGSFDFSHASTSPPSAAHVRDSRSISRALRSLAGRPERAASDARHEATAPRHMSRRAPRSARPTPPPAHHLFGAAREREATDALSRQLPTATSTRPRATPSERYLRRSEARIREERADMESAADLLDTLSDIPLANPFTLSHTNVRARSPSMDVGADRRQSKRRKRDHNATPLSAFDGFKYGYKGQVVAGRLKMQILSCDGGEYYEKDNPALYKVQNVLKNDKSVYCSESSRCNLLLNHIGDTPFSLEKVVIRAPHRGFTAPVQEGLVFVSMSADHLLSSTSSYNLHYNSPSQQSSPTPTSPQEDEQLSLQEAIEDPYIWHYSRHGTQEEMREQVENLRLRTARLNRESSLRSNRHRQPIRRHLYERNDDVYGDNCDHAAGSSLTDNARVSAPTPPPFTVTTASEEDDSDSNEDLPSAAVLADRLRRESRWRTNSEDEHEDDMPRFGGIHRAPALDFSTYSEWRDRRQQHLEPIRASQRATPSRIEPARTVDETDSPSRPHARFFIEKNKSRITIKFHPAISGKNILLKLWSPTQDGNIDIESVQFYGYSGPRFFPAMQPC